MSGGLLRELWDKWYAKAEGGPRILSAPKPREVGKEFLELMLKLRRWRQVDHADNIVLSRHEVIVLIEGVDVLASDVIRQRI